MNANSATNATNGPAPKNAAPSEINNFIADIEDVLAKAGHIVDADVTRLRESLREKMSVAKSGLTEGGRRVGEAARGAATATGNYVHRNPWQVIGIAAMTGAAVGYLVARR
jgi:ElaB/YqjD/DUF883 family membrane-anchored ribosome-binding protein